MQHVGAHLGTAVCPRGACCSIDAHAWPHVGVVMRVHLYGSCYYQEPPHTKHLQYTKHKVAFDTHALSHLNFTPCNVGTVIATVLMRKQRFREVQVTTEWGSWEKDFDLDSHATTPALLSSVQPGKLRSLPPARMVPLDHSNTQQVWVTGSDWPAQILFPWHLCPLPGILAWGSLVKRTKIHVQLLLENIYSFPVD